MVFNFFSCDIEHETSELYSIYHYEIDTLLIHSDECCVDTSDFDIVSVTPLQLPPNCEVINCRKYVHYRDKYYIMGDRSHTIHVYNKKGKFLYNLGERGHAKYEYICGPTDFSVDNETGDVYVYERDGQTVFRFDSVGNLVTSKRIIGATPYSMTYCGHGKFLMAYDYISETSNSQLSVLDSNLNKVKQLMELPLDKHVTVTYMAFFKSNRIYHVPKFADSVLVFNTDKLEKVVRLDFDGRKVLPEKYKQDAYAGGGFNSIFQFNDGIGFIIDYQESSNYVLVKYNDKHILNTFIKDKKRNKYYNGMGSIFVFDYPIYDCYLDEDYIVYVISSDDILNFKNNEDWIEIYNSMPNRMREIFDGKVQLPAIVKIKLK